jgi:cell division protein ZapA
MSKVTVIVNGRKYDIKCDDGQENHLTQLAQYVDRRVDELVSAVGQVGDARLLLMASLLVADELSEVSKELDSFKDDESGLSQNAVEVSEMESLANRIESIAEKLEAI